MYVQKIKYMDYNGMERNETFYFNFTKAEVVEMEYSVSGGLTAVLNQISETKDFPKLIAIFKDLILRAYGEKSADGKRFIKSNELSTAFSQTEAYSQLFMELATDAEAAAAFVNGIIPADMAKEAAAAVPSNFIKPI